MGCSASVLTNTADQNGNVKPAKQQPPPHSKQPTQPPPQHPPPPKQPAPPPVKQAAPPKQPTPPPPKEPTPPPPKEPTPPPPKEPTPPPPKEPTPPPPKEPTPAPQEPVQESSAPTDDNSKLTAEVLEEFINLEKQLQELRKIKSEEKVMLYELELKHAEESAKIKEKELSEAKEKALKEYDDIANFNVQAFMISNQISYLSKEQVEEARNKEEQEYLEAKNKEDICEKELDKLKMQLLKIKEKLDTVKLQVESLCALQDKQDGLLENIFNGDYGSELEEKLESEVDLLMQKKQKISGIHMTWVSSRELISLSCTQMLWSVNRWKQIAQYPQISNQGKFIMVTETRNYMINAHMNIRRASDLLKVNLPYWTLEDDKNMVMSINLVYNDVRASATFQRALAWYKYYHYRFVLLFNWTQQVLTNRFSVDAANVEKAFREKYQLLQMERLSCIKILVKEKLDIDLDIEQFRQVQEEQEEVPDLKPEHMIELTDNQVDENADLNKADDLPDVISQEADPTSMDALENNEESSVKEEPEEKKPEDQKEEEKPSDKGKPSEEEKPLEEKKPSEETTQAPVNEEDSQPASNTENAETTDSTSAPLVKAIPLDELAPLPSTEELFGEVEKLMDDVEKGEEILEKNKLRQEQELQERLRRRRSRRRRVQDLQNAADASS